MPCVFGHQLGVAAGFLVITAVGMTVMVAQKEGWG
jgi:hypothetical protein